MSSSTSRSLAAWPTWRTIRWETGLGALAGALYLASRRSVLGLGGWIARAAFLFGFSLVAFSFSRNWWLSLALLTLSGFGMMVGLASSNTVLQTLVEDDKRGRLMSFYTLAFMGMAPFGSLLAGVLAVRIGAPSTILFGGVCCVLGGLWFAAKLPALRRLIRPLYVQRGILADPADSLLPPGSSDPSVAPAPSSGKPETRD